MNCPNCGDNNAVALFTSVQCTNNQCQKYNQSYATEISMKSFIGRGTVTGRISSSGGPNLSNLPKKKQTETSLRFSPDNFYSFYINRYQKTLSKETV